LVLTVKLVHPLCVAWVGKREGIMKGEVAWGVTFVPVNIM
jgi:hypothetical protein